MTKKKDDPQLANILARQVLEAILSCRASRPLCNCSVSATISETEIIVSVSKDGKELTALRFGQFG